MATQAEHKIDRTGWPRGPWDSEPDRIHWIDEATGLDCLIVRNRIGALCGYVGVPQNHPAYGKDYDDVSVQVHGGLTYGERCGGVICHSPEEAANEPVWWLGFDCAHSGDFPPGLAWLNRVSLGSGESYRDVAYVRREVRSLAAQLKAMTP